MTLTRSFLHRDLYGLWRNRLNVVKFRGFSDSVAEGAKNVGFTLFPSQTHRVAIPSLNSELILCTSAMGHLSESSVLGRAGDTVVHVTVNSAFKSDAVEDFLPLTVDYRMRSSAMGIVPQKKERGGSDEEILVSRFIDRAIRPLFPAGYVNDVQVIATNHSLDGVHDPTVVAVNAASLALMASKQPWFGPIGCVRVGLIEGKMKVNPNVQEMLTSELDLLYAGTSDRTVM